MITTYSSLNNRTVPLQWTINTRINSTLPFNSDSNFNHSSQTIQLTSSALGFFLSFFCFITVFGNGLVIYAIVQERYLKSATYYYMASLACADLFVGLIVMPFAIVQVVYGDYWPFGRLCCDLWHSIDVCASTASILDLCVIALDRYSAITNPISYHRTFFVKRWPYLLIAVWLCSGLISFPAVAYWRLAIHHNTADRCLFPDDIYYIGFSSLISFYFPLFVMIFVYIRIYRAAIKQLHAFKTGVKLASPTNKRKKKKKTGSKDDSTPENAPPDICLRIHRGKYHGVPSLTRDSSSTMNPIDSGRASSPDERLTLPTQKLSANSARKSSNSGLADDHQNLSLSRFSMPSLGVQKSTVSSDHHQQQQLMAPITGNKRVLSQEVIGKGSSNNTAGTGTSIGKRLTKFSKEQKATITLAYVMGIFVICWLPFFVYNPLTAVAKLFITLRPDSTSMEKLLTGNELLFQMFTWLGYVNSSVNPIIYAYSSREFRRAFVKYLCRCFPIRIRNLMMSYHNLHLLRYRRTPESNMSKENIDSPHFDNHNNNNNNINNNNNNHHHHHHHLIKTNQVSSLSSGKQNSSRIKAKSLNGSSRLITSASKCCRSELNDEQTENNDKISSPTVSSRAAGASNVLVDYCTYHDVAVARVTCL